MHLRVHMLHVLEACRCRLFLLVLLVGLGLIKSIKVAEARRKKLQRNLLASSHKILRCLFMLIVASNYSVRGNDLKAFLNSNLETPVWGNAPGNLADMESPSLH